MSRTFSMPGRVAAGTFVTSIAASVALLAAVALPPAAAPAWAQAAGMAGAGETDTVNIRVTVKAVDAAKRTITLIGPHGDARTFKVGPDVQNLAQVKPGDILIVQLYESVAYVIAPPGTKLPDDSLAVVAARATPGEKPAGVVAEKLVVTGLVVGVNSGAKTVSMVDPAGGEVRTVTVKDPEYQKMLPMIKVGDTITAVISEAVVAEIVPAKS